MFRSLGVAYNEVVVALLDEPRSSGSLRHFAWLLTGGSTLGLLMIVATPLAGLYFQFFSALPAHLLVLATTAIWLALPLPALSVFQSWFQGAILHGRRTRGITEAVGIYLLTSAITLWAGVAWGQTTGLYIGLASFVISMVAQTAWLWLRSRPVVETLRQRDAQPHTPASAI